jgi:cysteine desulfurase
MGWSEAAAREVIRVSFGPETDANDVDRFLESWAALARRAPANAA